MGEREKWSNSIAFWSIATTQLSIRSGLSTAAHDLLIIASQDTGHHESKSLQLIMGNDLNFSRIQNMQLAECNPHSSGSVIAVCYTFNITAAIFIILFCYRLNPVLKIFLMELSLIAGLVLIASSNRSLLKLYGGTVFIGIAISIFELTIPPLATIYKVEATNAIASGAGIAQVMGSGIYFVARRFHMPHGTSFYIFVAIDLIGILIFFLLLETPEDTSHMRAQEQELWKTEDEDLVIIPLMIGAGGLEWEGDISLIATEPKDREDNKKYGCKNRKLMITHSFAIQHWEDLLNSSEFYDNLGSAFDEMKDIFLYLILFYFLEYYNNLGLLEHAAVHNSRMSTAAQYRTFMLVYHITQSICRSVPLKSWFVDKLAVITFIQAFITLCIFMQSLFAYIPWVEIMVLLVMQEGILGSLAYLIGLHQARSCSDKQSVKKIATILVLASEVAALGLGATAAMVSHKTICASKEHIKL